MNQKLWGRCETVKITATADRAASDLVNEGNWYGVCVDIIANTEEGMINIRGVFRLTKETTTEVIASGDFIEFVTGGTVQKYATGTKIGKAYKGSSATDETVDVILMPELY